MALKQLNNVQHGRAYNTATETYQDQTRAVAACCIKKERYCQCNRLFHPPVRRALGPVKRGAPDPLAAAATEALLVAGGAAPVHTHE
jgi:hypothetical protein